MSKKKTKGGDKGSPSDLGMVSEQYTALMERIDRMGRVNDEQCAAVMERMDCINNQLECLDGFKIEMKDFMNEIRHLKEQSVKKDEVIKSLTNRVEELEQNGKINDVIVTGLKIKPRNYATAVKSDDSSEEEIKSVETQVTEFLEKRNIKMNPGNVDTCYLLPKKAGSEKDNKTRAVVLSFTNKKHKMDLLKQCKNLKGTGVYVNENLTKKNATIAWKARQLKKDKKILNTWTGNCKVYIKTNGSGPETRPVLIRALEELEKYA